MTRFTPWPEAIPIVDIKAETVADAFFSRWIARFGTTATITTDIGAQLESKLWDNLCNQFGLLETVERVTTPSRTAWSNVLIVSLRPPLWHTNHRIHGLLHYQQYYSVFDPSLKNACADRPPKSSTVRRSDEFTEQYIIDAHTDINNYLDKLRVAMSRLRFCPLRNTPRKDIFQYKELKTCLHVFL